MDETTTLERYNLFMALNAAAFAAQQYEAAYHAAGSAMWSARYLEDAQRLLMVEDVLTQQLARLAAPTASTDADGPAPLNVELLFSSLVTETRSHQLTVRADEVLDEIRGTP